MRGLLTLLLLLPLAACGNATGADLLRAAVWPIPLPDSLFTPSDPVPQGEWDAAEASPEDGETALALALGSRRGLARLTQAEGERRMWRTQGGVVVATDGPRVVATAGLRQVLAATRFDGGTDPLARLSEIGDGTYRSARVIDVMRSASDPARMRFGLRLDCALRAAPSPAEDTLLFEESCRGAARFTNRFWADARSYAVFRSEQWIGDDLPPLVVEVVGAPPPAEVITLPR
ncbi:YjbF family lipoprotein [Neoroseomonas oryzicola]|uniref:YjbF family lipoprotein n=1 Tax=Neoroseomonas oryzicola TaxID=535904 RepID=A0A9X9WPT8_9PROT|nr:YjbF family lipoprotein [Neoroseomonas oryzicola]MBR0662348.1 YjbF family lipoprotein [Neoroseomonas oryzicola]NKE19250.1 YjbF family lipoprotein [Neoroseomonas oryzicola]